MKTLDLETTEGQIALKRWEAKSPPKSQTPIKKYRIKTI